MKSTFTSQQSDSSTQIASRQSFQAPQETPSVAFHLTAPLVANPLSGSVRLGVRFDADRDSLSSGRVSWKKLSEAEMAKEATDPVSVLTHGGLVLQMKPLLPLLHVFVDTRGLYA